MAYSRDAVLPGVYDLLVNDTPIMCLRLDQHGQPSPDGIIQYHAERLPFSPGTTTPEGAPYFIEPSMEQPEGFFAFSGGMGVRVQDPKRDRDTDSYYYAHFLDGNGDMVFNGPAVTTITPATTDATNGINDFFVSKIGGTQYIMALSGRYCLQRTADNAAGWGNITKDFGAGTNAVIGRVFRGTQTTPYAFVALKPPVNDVPLAPTLAHAGTGGTVADGTYGVEVVWTFANGESRPSASASVTTSGGGTSTITITSPAAYAGATGWYAYVTQSGGSTYTRQQAAGSPTAIGTNLTLTAPPTSSGANPVLNNYWVWDMASATNTWTQHASLGALDFAYYRSALWMLNQDSHGNYQVQQCLDGGTAPTWSGAFIVADATNPCTRLCIQNDKLFVRSQKGLLAVAASDTASEEPFGDMFKYVSTAPNQCAIVPFLQFLLVPMARSWFSYDNTGAMEEIGLGALRRNDSPIQGYPTAAVPYNAWYALAAFWSEANSTAYLMKWGNWKIYSTLFSPIPVRVFVPSLMGPLWEQSTRIQSLFIAEVAGGPYLYIGDAAGNVSFYRLPRGTPDATGDTSWTQFNTTTPFSLYLPGITRGNPGISKAATAVEVTGQNLNAVVSYRTGRTGAYGGSTNFDNNGVFNTDPGQRNNINSSVVSKWLDLLLTGTATSSSLPCIIESVVAYLIPRPPFKLVWTAKMLLGSRVPNKNGNPIVDWDTVSWLAAIVAMCETGPVQVYTPEGNDYLGVVTDFKLDVYYADWKKEDIEYIGTLQIMQHVPLNTQGEHIHLAQYTHASLANYTHQGLTTL